MASNTVTNPGPTYFANLMRTDPSIATAPRSFQLMEALTGRLGDFLVELAAAEMDETFPY